MQDDTKHAEELKRKIEELKRKASEEEVRRIEQEIEQRGQALAKSRLAKDEAVYQQELKAAQVERHREEEALKKRQEEISKKLKEERRKKEEAWRREKEEQERKEQEERRAREEEEWRRSEEEARRKAEEERQRLEQEAKRKAEEQRRQEEEELRRQEEERLRKEKEQKRKEEDDRRRLDEEIRRKEKERRKKIEDKENRIRSLIAGAQVFFDNNEYENASVEVAKALVNDPTNPDALELEQKIHDAQGKTKTEEVVEKSKAKEIIVPKGREEIQPKKKTLSLPVMLLFAVVALVVGAFVFIQLKKHVFEKGPTFAVMPWKSSSNTDAETVLGFSLAEEVAERFQHLPQTSVMGYSSAYGLASSVEDADKAVFRLGYDYVLQGTLTTSSTGFSVELKLVDSLGGMKWTDRYEKSASGIADVPGEIAQRVAEALKIHVEDGSSPWTIHHASANTDAYFMYLRGLEKLHHQTDQDTKDALELFKESIKHDGKFAEALLASANIEVTRIEEGWNTEDDALLQAKQWAEQAMEANASLGECYQALGRIMTQQREFQLALKEFDAALKLVPSSCDAFLNKAKVFLNIGKYNDAIDALNRAYELNPRDPEILTTLAFAHQLKGSVEEGFWYHITALFFVPDSTEYLVGPVANAILYEPALSLSQNSRVADACKRRFKANPGDYMSMYRLARMLEVNGNVMEGLSILNNLEILLRKELQAQPKNTDVMMYLALTLTRLGKYPEAVTLADKALGTESNNASVKYKIAQMYSVQMYSQKKKEIDAKKKERALKALREAIALNFRLDEITNADFYNLSGQPEFRSSIAQQLQ